MESDLSSVSTWLTLTLQDGVGRGVGVHGWHINCCVLRFGHAGEDQAVHAVKQGVGVRITAVQQVVYMVRMVGVVRGQHVWVLMGARQLAVVAEVVQVLIVLLYGSCCGEAGAGAVVLPEPGITNRKNEDNSS